MARPVSATAVAVAMGRSRACGYATRMKLQRSSFCTRRDGAMQATSFARMPELLPAGFLPWRVTASWQVSPDAHILRFALPEGIKDLQALGLLSGVKVREELDGHVCDKSYSPISVPEAEDHVDLLVKSYPPRPGGGLGHFLCGLQPGDSADVKLKPPRLLFGSAYARNRWSDIGFMACGTGIAPFAQMIRSVLSDPLDSTRLHLISCNRSEQDILLKDEFDALASTHPGRLNNTYVLSKPSSTWTGPTGRISLEHLKQALPLGSSSSVVMVCGTDQFLETVCGGHVRVEVPGKSKKAKLQGPTLGLLRDLGFTEAQVVKL